MPSPGPLACEPPALRRDAVQPRDSKARDWRRMPTDVCGPLILAALALPEPPRVFDFPATGS